MRLRLFQRDDCPLCDEALAILAAAGTPDFEPVWIDDDGGVFAQTVRARQPMKARTRSASKGQSSSVAFTSSRSTGTRAP